MPTRRTALRQLSGAALSLALVNIPQRRAEAADEIVVGNLLDSTGPINIYGLPMVDLTKFAIDDINASGGVVGKSFASCNSIRSRTINCTRNMQLSCCSKARSPFSWGA